MNQLQSKQKKQGSFKNHMHQTGQSPALFKANMHPYLQAQGIIGNHGILRRYNGDIIQAKLKIGQPNDKYEQEADRAADQVMSMPEPGMQKKSTSPECEEDTDEALQTKPIADRITPIVQRQEEQEEEEEAAPENEEEEDENYLESEPTRDAGELGEEEEESVQAKSLPNKSPLVTPGLQNQIRSLKGGGQPLSKSTRAFFEPRFGRDFSQVRVHTDKRAAILAKSMNAKAFTTGKDVVFGSGQYSPETTPGKRLLAHELIHVIQQKAAPKKNSLLNYANVNSLSKPQLARNNSPILQLSPDERKQKRWFTRRFCVSKLVAGKADTHSGGKLSIFKWTALAWGPANFNYWLAISPTHSGIRIWISANGLWRYTALYTQNDTIDIMVRLKVKCIPNGKTCKATITHVPGYTKKRDNDGNLSVAINWKIDRKNDFVFLRVNLAASYDTQPLILAKGGEITVPNTTSKTEHQYHFTWKCIPYKVETDV